MTLLFIITGALVWIFRKRLAENLAPVNVNIDKIGAEIFEAAEPGTIFPPTVDVRPVGRPGAYDGEETTVIGQRFPGSSGLRTHTIYRWDGNSWLLIRSFNRV